MSYKHNTHSQAIPLEYLVQALKSCLRTTCPNAEVSENFDLLFVQQLYKHEKFRSELYISNKIQFTLTDKMTSLSTLVDSLEFPQQMKDFIKSLMVQVQSAASEISEKNNSAKASARSEKNPSAKRVKIPGKISKSSDTCKNQRPFDIEQVIEKRSPPIPKLQKGPVKLTSSLFSKKLDKVQRSNLKDELSKVSVKYPHFSQCNGCALCETAFKNLNVTYCSKKHGGPACNSLGLYPHATATYLSVLHSTKKFVGSVQGFQNPLVEENIVEEMSTDVQDKISEPSNTSAKQEKVEKKVPDWRSVAPNENTQGMLSIVQRQMYAAKWKLTSDSEDSAYLEALDLMTKIKKRYPNYVPPTWATIVSKVLFDSGNIDAAKRTACYFRERYVSKRAKRIERARRRANMS